MKVQLNLKNVDKLRNTDDKSALLFLTDRCPVGCAHCSVDSRVDSPTIEDYERFEAIVDGLCSRNELELVGISGGEPFVEKRGLTLAVEKLSTADKAIALYTSGVWANPNHKAPGWISEMLAKVACVFLSTDAYHAASVSDDVFNQAVCSIVESGAWLIVQVLDRPEHIVRAEDLLKSTLGEHWENHAELSLVPPLPYGRANDLFVFRAKHAVESFGKCPSLAAPVIRYDGKLIACCNEAVLMGSGPDRLRQTADTASDLNSKLDGFRDDPLLATMRKSPIGRLVHHPRYRELKGRAFNNMCEACWLIQDCSAPVGKQSDPILNILSNLEGFSP